MEEVMKDLTNPLKALHDGGVPTSTSVPSASSPPPTHSLGPTPSSASPETTQLLAPGVILYVVILVVITVVISGLVLVIICIRRKIRSDAQLSGDPSDRSTLYKRSGGEITVECSFSSSETRKYFCREPCGEKDVLVQTTGVRAQRGRYSFVYVPGSPSGGSLFVSISQLNKADSGRYRCALDRPLSPDPHREFELVVSDIPTSTSVPSASSPPPTHSLGPTPSSASPETTQQSATTTPDVLLYVGVTLAVMVVLLSLTLLIFCRRKSSKLQEPPEETEYAYVTETNRVYEDIREDMQSRSPPVEMSSVYTSAKYTKPSRADANDDHSFVITQNTVEMIDMLPCSGVYVAGQAEDESSQLTYSELNFSNRAAGLGGGVLHGGDDNVIYSVPRDFIFQRNLQVSPKINHSSLTLQAAIPALTARRRVLRPTEGGRVTVACSFAISRDRKFLCKQDCKEEILIETMSNKSENGRYGIEYTKTFYLSYPVLYVSITQLRKSDSGWYRCGLGSPLSSDSHEDFEIIVKDAPTTSKPKWTLRPSSATVPSTSTATTTLSFTASSVSHEAEADPAPTTSKPNWTLQPSSSSAPSTSTTTTTTTQSLSSSSESFTASSVSSKTTKKFEQRPALAASADPALQAAIPALTARRRVLRRTEGRHITVACSFAIFRDRKFLCKQDCKEEILIETMSNKSENGRYGIEYTKTFYLSYPLLYF
ncbi:hypothetical protein L3Q82_003649 [Scortum barcoo]|uniref:Uncharacterized protein n=1 Tax=Scortum barcoo TaxID=214431 RepID=A0ACB8VNC4_9TELE|nr:hypothetical protein L3Q82_003649 [Scortum barcoo]